MLYVLDVGCRYGVHETFNGYTDLIHFSMVDCDRSEISRLKKKYSKKTNMDFYNAFLGEKNGFVNLFISEHKGYISSKTINEDSIWFGKVRKDEKKIIRKIKQYSYNSSYWIKKNKIKHDIIKIDLEGGELEFLKGLRQNDFDQIEALIVEAHIDTTYNTDSNFSSLHKILSENNFFLASFKPENVEINIFHSDKDKIPSCLNTIYLKKEYIYPEKVKNNKKLTKMINTALVLKQYGILFEILLNHKNILKKNKGNIFFQRLKFEVGHLLNKKQKNINFNYEKANKLYNELFGEKFPKMNEFYENDFFNPS
tara:strand:+ start:179 stop:1111 length:933 start_codon:yes stop_codon:yes gene_type:complete